MARYSPTIREDPGGPLDFSPITSALRTMQDNRLRRRQLQLWEDREAEDQRIQRERERVSGEERVNDVRRRGGVPLLQAPIGQPTLRDLTPSSETEVPRALGGGRIAPILSRRSSVTPEFRPEGTGRFTETVDGETYLLDPLAPAMRQEHIRATTERARLTSSGRVARTLLSGIPTYRDRLGDLTDEDLGRLPLSEVDALVRVGSPKPMTAKDDVVGQARALGLDVSGMSPGEAAQRVAMAEREWENRNRPASADDENRRLIRDERAARAKAAFADRMVQAMGGTVRDERQWRAADLDEARRLGMTLSDYRAAEQRYKDRPNTASARAERSERGVSGAIARLLEEEDGATPPPRGGTAEQGLSDADLWELKVSQGMSPDEATAYVRRRAR